jgi:hypothetical protein
MLTKRSLEQIKERVDSAIRRLRRLDHPVLDDIIAMDLEQAKKDLNYAIEVTDA